MKLLAITDQHPTGQPPIGADWGEQAACREEDPELFFPLHKSSSAEEEAKAICRRCPAATDCLIWAVETKQQYGILGGLNEEQRMKLKGGRTRKPSVKSRRIICQNCKKVFIATSDRSYCLPECMQHARRQKDRQKIYEKYPLSRIA